MTEVLGGGGRERPVKPVKQRVSPSAPGFRPDRNEVPSRRRPGPAWGLGEGEVCYSWTRPGTPGFRPDRNEVPSPRRPGPAWGLGEGEVCYSWMFIHWMASKMGKPGWCVFMGGKAPGSVTELGFLKRLKRDSDHRARSVGISCSQSFLLKDLWVPGRNFLFPEFSFKRSVVSELGVQADRARPVGRNFLFPEFSFKRSVVSGPEFPVPRVFKKKICDF